MRAVAMLVVGIAVGALGAVTAVGAMKKDIPIQKASMTLMRHHFGALRKMGEGGQCDAVAIQRHLSGMQSLSREFDAFLPTGGDDASFTHHAGEFGSAIDAAVAAPPADCAALASTNQTLGGTCKGCHDEFRG
jgi:cytochrome c556